VTFLREIDDVTEMETNNSDKIEVLTPNKCKQSREVKVVLQQRGPEGCLIPLPPPPSKPRGQFSAS